MKVPATALLVAFAMALASSTLPARAAGQPPVHGRAAPRPCSAGLVALTFDDGPSPKATARLVRILTARHVPATFFMMGSHVRTDPADARLVARNGFAVGNHTWSHPVLTRLSDAAVRHELVSTTSEQRRKGIRPSGLMRPPYGVINSRVRRIVLRQKLVPVLWTIDSRDWAGGTSRQIAARVLGAPPQAPHEHRAPARRGPPLPDLGLRGAGDHRRRSAARVLLRGPRPCGSADAPGPGPAGLGRGRERGRAGPGQACAHPEPTHQPTGVGAREHGGRKRPATSGLRPGRADRRVPGGQHPRHRARPGDQRLALRADRAVRRAVRGRQGTAAVRVGPVGGHPQRGPPAETGDPAAPDRVPSKRTPCDLTRAGCAVRGRRRRRRPCGRRRRVPPAP